MNEIIRSGTAGTYRVIGLGVLAAVFVAVVAVYLFAAGGDEPEPRILGLIDNGPPDVGQPAPDFALPDVRDEENVLKLSDFRGKVVILNWYASWCGPCRQEIPDFEVAHRHLDADVVFFGVNLQESRATAAGLLEELGATYPAVLDADGAVSQHYRVTGMPVTYIIDRDGMVVAGGRGILTEDALRRQLAEFGLTYPES
ncbi:MAG: TlpA disulfide reductase family protein [Dehalococcoidia bacterium]|nr:TlpA family protein disulfide reductase [Dehalococcoidia bacterium]MCA9824911.1 TlpA family protein disulfide reductase [Dehalococcoidia bacterium]